MKKKSWGKAVLLCFFALALLFAWWNVRQVGSHLQYLVEAPALTVADTQNAAQGTSGASDGTANNTAAKVKPNKTIDEWRETLTDAAADWKGVINAWTLGGVIDQASLSADNGGVGQGRLTLLGENGLTLHPLYLRYGRLFYPEEITRGDKVMLLDEQMALKMFNISDPLERTVVLGEDQYKVIGIVRHEKRVGDDTDAGAYIPLESVIGQALVLDALQVEADPISGVGASVTFKAAMETWQPGGTLIDLGKESMAATLWLRVLIFLVAITLVLRAIRWLNSLTAYRLTLAKEKLRRQYAIALTPEFAGWTLLLAAGYALALALAALSLNYLIKPVYTFPEWVPAVLVEWDDIQTAFWKVWQTSATLKELRTPELMRLRYFTLLIQGCSAAAGVLLFMMYARIRGKSESTAESLSALYREGVTVSTLHTFRPLAFSALGYLPWGAENEDAPRDGKKRSARKSRTMVRIINARRILEQLPPSGREGSFVLDVTDGQIAPNNHRFLITCTTAGTTVEDAERDWDLQLPVETLTRLVYGTQSFRDFVESNAGFDLKMRSPAMDGLFAHHLTLTENGAA